MSTGRAGAVRVRIGELVVEGLRLPHRHRLGPAVEAALTRRIEAEGLSLPAGSRSVRSIRVDDVGVGRRDVDTLAEAIAGALHRGLEGEDR